MSDERLNPPNAVHLAAEKLLRDLSAWCKPTGEGDSVDRITIVKDSLRLMNTAGAKAMQAAASEKAKCHTPHMDDYCACDGCTTAMRVSVSIRSIDPESLSAEES